MMHASTMFFMVTGEGSFARWSAPSSCCHTDYILKPFTADNMLERIGRALDKRNAFVPVYELIDVGNERAAVPPVPRAPACIPVTLPISCACARNCICCWAADAEPIYAALYGAKAIVGALGQAKTQFLLGEYRRRRARWKDCWKTTSAFSMRMTGWRARTGARQTRNWRRRP